MLIEYTLPLAVAKNIPYQAYFGESRAPEQVRYIFDLDRARTDNMCSSSRPIPQWFRLKTDTKIQVHYHPFAFSGISRLMRFAVQRQEAALEKDQTQHLKWLLFGVCDGPGAFEREGERDGEAYVIDPSMPYVYNAIRLERPERTRREA